MSGCRRNKQTDGSGALAVHLGPATKITIKKVSFLDKLIVFLQIRTAAFNVSLLKQVYLSTKKMVPGAESPSTVELDRGPACRI